RWTARSANGAVPPDPVFSRPLDFRSVRDPSALVIASSLWWPHRPDPRFESSEVEMYGRSVRALAGVVLMLLASVPGRAQDAGEEASDQAHDMSQMDMASSSWRFMQDGSFSAVFNHQGGPRGGNQVTGVNWWMGMLSRPVKSGQLTLTGMFSLEPATVGARGYRELFQSGEA